MQKQEFDLQFMKAVFQEMERTFKYWFPDLELNPDTFQRLPSLLTADCLDRLIPDAIIQNLNYIEKRWWETQRSGAGVCPTPDYLSNLSKDLAEPTKDYVCRTIDIYSRAGVGLNPDRNAAREHIKELTMNRILKGESFSQNTVERLSTMLDYYVHCTEGSFDPSPYIVEVKHKLIKLATPTTSFDVYHQRPVLSKPKLEVLSPELSLSDLKKQAVEAYHSTYDKYLYGDWSTTNFVYESEIDQLNSRLKESIKARIKTVEVKE